MKLFFASGNANKLSEVRQILGSNFSIIGLNESGFTGELPETHETVRENAAEKAHACFQLFHLDCFSEDTGLEVAALNGAPGVYSARYAGEGKNAADNVALVLRNLQDIIKRNAQFRTVICLIFRGKEFFFEGIVKGTIAHDARGISGFGYDPVFIPEGSSKTFAEMSSEEKNSNSHRRLALEAMKEFLLKESY